MKGYAFKTSMLAAAIALSGCSPEPAAVTPNNTATQTDSSIIVSPNDQREYKAITLENGLTVLLVSDSEIKKSAASLSVGVGLLHDPKEQQGMAHYLEHLLFMGTERFPDPDGYSKFMTEHGGSSNAYTWLDITNYMFSIDNTSFSAALDRFADFFKAPLLDAKYTEKEKSAVNAEWSMRREMDYFGMYKLDRAMMGDHPANRFLIGNNESLVDTKTQTLNSATKAFFQKYYSANIMKLSLISNQPISEMEAMAKKYFTDIKNKNIPEPEVTATLEFKELGNKLIHFVPQKDLKEVQIEYVIDNNQRDFLNKPNYYLNYIIGSEMPNTLASVLKGQGLISSLSAGASPADFGNYGSFKINLNLTDAGMAKRDEIVQLVVGYIEHLQKTGIDDRYFNEIKTSLSNQFRFLDKTDDFSYASALAASMQDYPINHVLDSGYVFEAFNKEEVSTVLNQLTRDRLRVWYISKDEPTDEQLHYYAGKYSIKDLELPSTKALAKTIEASPLQLPATNRLLPKDFTIFNELKSSKPTQVAGLNFDVYQAASEHFGDQPKGINVVQLNTDIAAQSAKNYVLGSLWSSLYRLKNTGFLAEASAAGLGVNVTFDSGISFSIAGFTDRQNEAINRVFNSLGFEVSQQDLDQAIDRYQRAVANSERSFPVRQLFPAYSRLTVADVFSKQDRINAAKTITLDEFNQFRAALTNNIVPRVFMMGNYRKADAVQLATQITEQVNLVDEAPYKTKVWRPEAGQFINYQKDIPVEDLGMMWIFTDTTEDVKRRAAANILSKHASNKIFNSLRTEEQLAYAVGITPLAVKDYAGLAMYIQTPVKNPVDMYKRFDEFRSQYEKMLAELEGKAFDTLKTGVLNTLTQKPKSIYEEFGRFAKDWDEQNYNFDSQSKLIEATKAVQPEDLNALYHDLVMADQAPKILIQLRGKKFSDQPFANIDKATNITDIDAFHKTMTKQD